MGIVVHIYDFITHNHQVTESDCCYTPVVSREDRHVVFRSRMSSLDSASFLHPLQKRSSSVVHSVKSASTSLLQSEITAANLFTELSLKRLISGPIFPMSAEITSTSVVCHWCCVSYSWYKTSKVNLYFNERKKWSHTRIYTHRGAERKNDSLEQTASDWGGSNR